MPHDNISDANETRPGGASMLRCPLETPDAAESSATPGQEAGGQPAPSVEESSSEKRESVARYH